MKMNSTKEKEIKQKRKREHKQEITKGNEKRIEKIKKRKQQK